jgi:hypothetical protein
MLYHQDLFFGSRSIQFSTRSEAGSPKAERGLPCDSSVRGSVTQRLWRTWICEQFFFSEPLLPHFSILFFVVPQELLNLLNEE